MNSVALMSKKNEINLSDPLFLAAAASVSKDHRTNNQKERLLIRLVLRAADYKAATFRAALQRMQKTA